MNSYHQPIKRKQLLNNNIDFIENNTKNVLKYNRIYSYISLFLFVAFLYSKETLILYAFLYFFSKTLQDLIFTFLNLLSTKLFITDIFFGWSFEAEKGQTRSVGKFIENACSSLIPYFGPVCIVPPPVDNEQKGFQDIGMGTLSLCAYGLKAIDEKEWQRSVAWLMSQCRAAVFDLRNGIDKNLRWEILKASKRFNKENIILIREVDGKAGIYIGNREICPTFFDNGYKYNQFRKADIEEVDVTYGLLEHFYLTLPVNRLFLKRRFIWNFVGAWTSDIMITFSYLVTIGILIHFFIF